MAGRQRYGGTSRRFVRRFRCGAAAVRASRARSMRRALPRVADRLAPESGCGQSCVADQPASSMPRAARRWKCASTGRCRSCASAASAVFVAGGAAHDVAAGARRARACDRLDAEDEHEVMLAAGAGRYGDARRGRIAVDAAVRAPLRAGRVRGGADRRGRSRRKRAHDRRHSPRCETLQVGCDEEAGQGLTGAPQGAHQQEPPQEKPMAVQQNKKSPSKRGMHRAHASLANPPLAVEPVTGETHRRHHISPNGFLPRQEGRQDQGRRVVAAAPACACARPAKHTPAKAVPSAPGGR